MRQCGGEHDAKTIAASAGGSFFAVLEWRCLISRTKIYAMSLESPCFVIVIKDSGGDQCNCSAPLNPALWIFEMKMMVPYRIVLAEMLD
jgi:hypothetical protein